MKLLLFILTTVVFFKQSFAQEVCVVATQDGQGYKYKTKTPTPFVKGNIFKPLKFNKKKTYLLVDFGGYTWISTKNLKKKSGLDCKPNKQYSEIHSVIESKTNAVASDENIEHGKKMLKQKLSLLRLQGSNLKRAIIFQE